MATSNQQYLEQLIEWGEHVKDVLTSGNFPENQKHDLMKQLEDWQGKISAVLSDENRNLDDATIQDLKTEGEQLVAPIQGKEPNRKEIKTIPYGKHQLPPLPYEYDALEPYISEEIMRLHHNKHNNSYVEELN